MDNNRAKFFSLVVVSPNFGISEVAAYRRLSTPSTSTPQLHPPSTPVSEVYGTCQASVMKLFREKI